MRTAEKRADCKVNYKAVVFDLDGTLYCKKHLTLRICFHCLRSLNFIKNMQAVRDVFKGTDFSTQEKLYENFFNELACRCRKTPETAMDWYMNRFYPAFIHVLKKHYRPAAGVESLLHCLKAKNISAAVYSDYGFIPERLRAIGIDPSLFVFTISAESCGALKPAPRPLSDLAKKMHCDSSRVLVIGDRDDTDGEAARKCGMKFAWYRGGDIDTFVRPML